MKVDPGIHQPLFMNMGVSRVFVGDSSLLEGTFRFITPGSRFIHPGHHVTLDQLL